jgi:hypothetical protein
MGCAADQLYPRKIALDMGGNIPSRTVDHNKLEIRLLPLLIKRL